MKGKIVEMFCESMADHLKDRGIDFSRIQPVVDEETGLATFFLYDLSGRIVGYQTYNPKGSKSFNQSKADRMLMKYFTWVSGSKKGKDKKIGVWGLESYVWDAPYLFASEGIFDAAPFHQFDLPAIALLTNDPTRSTRRWLDSLPQKVIILADDDEAEGKEKKNRAGDKLVKSGDMALYPPSPYKDFGEFWEADKEGFREWVAKLKQKLGLV